MGWLSWGHFGCDTYCDDGQCINEQLYQEQAELLVKGGFREAGYVYVNVDDCWSMHHRNAAGQLVADPARFPSGIKGLADFMHERGLKLGLYTCVANQTCAGYPGSSGHFVDDANLFAAWGVDMVKADGCYADRKRLSIDYPAFGHALKQTGRPIVYSCSWPFYIPGHCESGGWGCSLDKLQETCNLWRNFDDITELWGSVRNISKFWTRSYTSPFVRAAGPGHWNDPDMLLVGDVLLSKAQQEAVMALWAVFAAPLLMSNDLRTLTRDAQSLLLNAEIIAVSQDSLGEQGGCSAACASDQPIFVRRLVDDCAAVVFLNKASSGLPIRMVFNSKMTYWARGNTPVPLRSRDLLHHLDVPSTSIELAANVQPTSVMMYKCCFNVMGAPALAASSVAVPAAAPAPAAVPAPTYPVAIPAPAVPSDALAAASVAPPYAAQSQVQGGTAQYVTPAPVPVAAQLPSSPVMT